MRIVIQIDTGDETPTVITDTGAATIPPWPTDGAPVDLTASSETALAGGTGGPYRQQPAQPSTSSSPSSSGQGARRGRCGRWFRSQFPSPGRRTAPLNYGTVDRDNPRQRPVHK